MRACVIALLSAGIIGAAIGCAPPDEERCGDSGKYYWDDQLNACFEVGGGTPIDTTPVDTTPRTDSDTDTNIDGLGQPCSAFGADMGGCAGLEANFCAYNVPWGRGDCSVTCQDTSTHSDCPDGWYCCSFVPKPGSVFCISTEFWNSVSTGTCTNWTESK